MNKIDIDMKVPEKLAPLFRRSRYKILWGGRGGAKSWGIAAAFVIMAMVSPIRILCCREIQESIAESVHKLLEDTIYRLGVESVFVITDKSIKCKNGSEFTFIGLKSAIKKIKSYEGYDYCWIEEGEFTSRESLDKLIPTIRKSTPKEFPNKPSLDSFLNENPELNIPEYVKEDELIVCLPAEIWISFNPNMEDDPVYVDYIKNTPKSCIKININWDDNSFFPATLEEERARCKEDDPDKYKNIWLGLPVGSGGLIYGNRFDKKHHVPDVKKDDLLEQIAKRGNAYNSMDPHSKYYPFCIWIAVIPNEDADGYQKIIYNEFPTYDFLGGWYADLRKKKRLELGLKQVAQMIYSADGTEYGINILGRYVDTRYSKGAGGENVMTNSVGLIETFKRPENGALVLSTPQEKMIDIQRMNILSDLDFNKNVATSPFNHPALFVAPWCKNVIHMLENHRDTLDGKTEDEKYKDASDALRIMYAGMINKPFVDKIKKKMSHVYHKRSWMG